MRHYQLNHHERLATGFTDLIAVRYTDFTSAVAQAPQTINLIPLAVGDLVGPEFLAEVKTTWAGLTSAEMEIGITGNTNRWSGSFAVISAKVVTALHDIAPLAVAAATQLTATLTPDPQALNAATAGELRIWMRISRKAQRTLQA